ncbi:hypothetical protein [Kutzneria sp. NPDC051319]|uniref:hypothetical protein n=1 Tax=Kutzneria sp. NPDC051319 TaxID=3155047 RepID=UPI0034454881
MRARDERQLAETVRPELAAGERIELLGQASVTTTSAKEQVGVAVATAVLSGGTAAATVVPETMYLVLTDCRLLVLRPGLTMRRSKVVASLPRRLITLSGVKQGPLKVKFKLAVAGEPVVFRVAFIFAKADGRRFAEVLGEAGARR